jgi:hypothetical protein
MKKLIFFAVLIYGCTAISCTDIEPTPYSDITFDKLLEDIEANAPYILAPIYGQYRWFNEDRSVWDLNELATDAWVIPTNTDGGWYDGGIWQRLHKHEWRAADPHFSEVWNHLWYGVTTCNRVLYQFKLAKYEIPESLEAEIFTARAYYYYQLLSLFGNVPIVDTYEVPEGFLPTTAPRKEVYDFVVSQLRYSMDKLPEEPRYSRFNKWATKQMLARTYLNAEAWLGAEYASKRDSCRMLCDEIIGSGRYSLDGSFSHVFSLENESSPEIIWAIPYDETTGSPIFHCIYAKTQHWMAAPIWAAASAGYNGLRATPSFLDIFDAIDENNYNDKRYAGTYCMGQQYDYNTKEPLYFSDGVTPFDYTKEIASLTAAREFDGYRFYKYEIKIGQKWETDQDCVVFRYGETLMMKAECLLRSGNAAGAAEIVNEVRSRSFDESLPQSVRELTAAQLNATVEVDGVQVEYGEFLKELGREFVGEGMRRDQLLRWNLYTKGTWTFHTPKNSDYLKIFPIPSSEALKNENLKQNPGYVS